MVARVAVGGALLFALAGYSGTLTQSGQPQPSDALLGRWDLVVERGAQTSPSWLEVERSGPATDRPRPRSRRGSTKSGTVSDTEQAAT
jgi:hypothetical protein